MTQNRDVPDLERCQALAKAGWNQKDCRHYWIVPKDLHCPPYLCDGFKHADIMGHAHFAAPTIGQMLACAAEREWLPKLERTCSIRSAFAGILFWRATLQGECNESWKSQCWVGVSEKPANALAEALAAAMMAAKEIT